MLTELEKGYAKKIGQYYLEKNGDDYTVTAQHILDLRISKIEVKDDKIYITTERPGLLLGRRGENIVKLEKFLGLKVRILEECDPLIYYLIPEEHENLELPDKYDPDYDPVDYFQDDFWGDPEYYNK